MLINNLYKINTKKIKGKINLYLNDLFLFIVFNLVIKRAYEDKIIEINKIDFLIFPVLIRLWILISANFLDFKIFLNLFMST